jgi:ribosome-binding factor A
MVSKMRAQRIGDRIAQELAEMLIMEINDPRLKGVSVTEVVVDRELAYANIYVSAVEGASRSPEILDGMRSASGFLRSELARRVKLRTFPQLRFHWDPTPDHADHIERLFARMQEEENARRNQGDNPEPGDTQDGSAE